MKKYLFYSLLALLYTAMIFSSCKKDENDPQPDNSTQTTKTETLKDSYGNVIGTRTTTTTTVNGQTTTQVVIKDIDGNVIDNNATFTVTYNTTDGVEGLVPAAQSGKFGETITIANQGTLKYSDWEFLGWNTKSDYSGKTIEADSSLTLTENLNLYAMWGVNYEYAIQFDPNGATDGEYPPILYLKNKYFKEIELPKPTLVKGKLVFKGWCGNAEGKQSTTDILGSETIYPAGETIKEGDSYFSKLKYFLSLKANYSNNYTATLYAIYGEPESEVIEKLPTVIINHSSTKTYKVWIDDKLVATWTSSGTYSFKVSPNVKHELYIQQQDGYVLTPTSCTKYFTLKPGESITFSGPQSSTSTSYFN